MGGVGAGKRVDITREEQKTRWNFHPCIMTHTEKLQRQRNTKLSRNFFEMTQRVAK